MILHPRNAREHAMVTRRFDQQINLTAQTFGVDDAVREHLQMHKADTWCRQVIASGIHTLFLKLYQLGAPDAASQSRIDVVHRMVGRCRSPRDQRNFLALAHSANSRRGPDA